MRTITLISVLLIMTSGASAACGLYAVRGHYKPLRNKLFLMISGSLILWAVGLMLTIAASSKQFAFIGRRIAPLGWGAINPLSLHFFLLMTGENVRIRGRWVYPLLYLPGVGIVIAYSIHPLFGLNPDVLIHTDIGWINYSRLDVWDYMYYAYTFVCVVLCLEALRRWGRRTKSAAAISQSRIIGGSMLVAATLSAATDVAPSFLNTRLPQMAAIFMLLLISAIAHCINHYSFLQPEEENPDESILQGTSRTHVYQCLALVILAIDLCAFLGRNLLYQKILTGTATLFSGILLICAVYILIINRLKLHDSNKEMLLSVCFSFLIPFVTIWFANFNMLTAWAVVFVLLIICLLFNRSIILASMIVTTILTQLLQWAYMPEVNMVVNERSHIIRLAVIGLASFMALYVNRIYTRRLRENTNHVKIQYIISEISHDFVGSSGGIEDKLYAALERCGRFLECDGACLALTDSGMNSIRYFCGWPREGVASQAELFGSLLREAQPEIGIYLHREDILILKDARFLHPAEASMKRRLAEHNIRALVALPIKNDREGIVGWIGFSSVNPIWKWNIISPTFLRIIAGIVSDAVSAAKTEQELNRIAYHDPLTGLPNRILFQEKLSQAIQAAKASETMLGIAFLDLDSFKAVNDMMGHGLGDRFLAEAARILSRAVRTSDVVARFGGDEFILMIDHISRREELPLIMERVMEITQKPVVLDGQEFFISVSGGLAIYPQDGTDPETLIKYADTAMYSAKSMGKGQYALCSQEMKDETLHKMKLTNLLYRAQENGQLVLHYQPQIDVETQRIVGLEALIRWNLPEYGLLGPSSIIPLAEQTGLIHPIGEWMLITACEQNVAWQAMGHSGLRIAVNVSAHQLMHPRFVNLVEDVLIRTGLEPKCLELEITESVASFNMEEVVEILNRLKAIGVSISIDDFGTEYSSLSRLKLLPVDRIKMDMQFVQGIDKNEKDQAISRVIINLAKSLDIKVIAEGVETEPQYEFLSERKCDEIQGFLYYKPMPAGEVEAVLMGS